MDPTYETILESIRCEMDQDPSHQVGNAIQAAFSALDELICLAASGETRDLVTAEKIALGQLLTRCELLAGVSGVRKQ